MSDQEVRSLTLRLPADLHQQLSSMADADLRSLQQEIVWLLRRAVLESTYHKPQEQATNGKQAE